MTGSATEDRSAPAGRFRAGGRSHHKAQTRQALLDSALALFAAQGYDATSTDQITERAGVSPRTFFRYFETKQEVLFFGGDAFNRTVVRELPKQPPEVRDLDALARTMIMLAPTLVVLKPRIRLYFQAVEGSTALRGRHVAATASHDAAVADALAARRSLAAPDESCRLAAAVATVTMDRAYRIWLATDRDLAEVTGESFARVRALIGRDRA